MSSMLPASTADEHNHSERKALLRLTMQSTIVSVFLVQDIPAQSGHNSLLTDATSRPLPTLRAYDLCWAAEHERAGRNLATRSHYRTRANQTFFANLRTIKDNRTHTDQGKIVD